MAKQTPETRLLSLMEEVKWKDIDNWSSIIKELREKEFMPFRTWLRQNLIFIPNDRARQAIEKYYILQEAVDYKSGFAVYLREGKSCLVTAYQKDKLYGK